MDRLDTLLIERVFSPAAGFCEHRLGISRWQVSMECLNGHLAFYVGGLALTIAGKGLEGGIFGDMLSALVWLLMMEGVRRVARRQAGSSLGTQTARMREWHFRTIIAAAVPISLCYANTLASACYSVSMLFLLGHLAFKASDSPPPQTRRQFARSRA
jgi:hypothetical protein